MYDDALLAHSSLGGHSGHHYPRSFVCLFVFSLWKREALIFASLGGGMSVSTPEKEDTTKPGIPLLAYLLEYIEVDVFFWRSISSSVLSR